MKKLIWDRQSSIPQANIAALANLLVYGVAGPDRSLDTNKLLKRPVGVAITDKSGAAGIMLRLEAAYEIEIPKHDPHVIAIKDKIDDEYAADRIAAISDDEMIAWAEEVFGENLPALR